MFYQQHPDPAKDAETLQITPHKIIDLFKVKYRVYH